jgi:hypothetical protein
MMVNIVLATDIMDKDLGTLRKERWNNAFAGNTATHDSSFGTGIGQTFCYNKKCTFKLMIKMLRTKRSCKPLRLFVLFAAVWKFLAKYSSACRCCM